MIARPLIAILLFLVGLIIPLYAGPPQIALPEEPQPQTLVVLVGHPHSAALNWYAYAGGDPVNRVDPSGLDWEWEGNSWKEIPNSPQIPLPTFRGSSIGETWPATITVAAIKGANDEVEDIAKKKATAAQFGIVSSSAKEFSDGMNRIAEKYVAEGKIKNVTEFKIRTLVRYGHGSAGVGGTESLSETDTEQLSKFFSAGACIEDFGCFGGTLAYEQQYKTMFLLSGAGGFVKGYTDFVYYGGREGIRGTVKLNTIPVIPIKKLSFEEGGFIPAKMIADALHRNMPEGDFSRMIGDFSGARSPEERAVVLNLYRDIISSLPQTSEEIENAGLTPRERIRNSLMRRSRTSPEAENIPQPNNHE